MTLPPQALTALLAGAVQGIVFVLIAFAVKRYTRQILFAVLIAAAAVYVGFALYRGAGNLWLVIELAGVVVYGGVGYRGLSGSLGWLAAGWALHPIWDIPLHFFGPGASFAPESYTVPCFTFDLVVAGVVALVAAHHSRLTTHEPLGVDVSR